MRVMFGILAGLAAVTGSAQAASSPLGPSPSEARMIATVDEEQARTLKFLETMVNQNSGSRNQDGVRKVRDIVIPEFTALGFSSRWIAMEQTERAGHLVLTHKGRKGAKKMLLIGHLDTVFEPDSPFQRYVLQGDKAIGPGVGDDGDEAGEELALNGECAGVACVGLGLLPLGFTGIDTPVLVVAALLVLEGMGQGLLTVAYTDIVTATLPARDRGVAGSLSLLTRTIGIVAGASVLTALQAHGAQGFMNMAGFLAGYRFAFVAAGGGLLAVLLLSLLWPGVWAAQPLKAKKK